jgi:5-formyltetrahydrofolate cyclo-ligase
MNSAEAKAEHRAVMRKQREGLNASWVLTASSRIAERVIALAEFNRAEVVCCYLALPGEAQTQAIMEAAWKAGKRIAVPCARDDGEYMPAWFTPNEPLTRGRFSVRQPATPHWAKPRCFDLVLVPGLAFSETGARLGHGLGFYDRMLARLGRHVNCKTGLCFAAQITSGFPVAEHDVGMDVVITENAVYRTT